MAFLSTTTLVDAAWSPPTTTGGTHWWRRIFQIATPPLCAGDVLLITGATCLVNPTSYNVQFVDEVTFGGYPNWVDDGPPWGYVIKPPGGMNIAPANHYWRPDLAWQWQTPCDQPAANLEWRVMCHADSADGTACTMLPGYGGMQVRIS